MSTANFITQSDFDMYVIDFEPLSEEEQKQYELETGCAYSIEIEEKLYYESEVENFKWLMNHYLKQKQKMLEFCSIELIGGYYAGVQTYVDILDDPREMDNEGCQYYFGICRSKAIRKLESEIKFINTKLLPYIRDNSSFEKLYCVGVFSNGEAIYQYADRHNQKEIV